MQVPDFGLTDCGARGQKQTAGGWGSGPAPVRKALPTWRNGQMESPSLCPCSTLLFLLETPWRLRKWEPPPRL